MHTYEVHVRTSGIEIYSVDAKSEREAREIWFDGHLILSEVWDADVDDVRRIEE